MTQARAKLLREEEGGVFHCHSRCVRRAHLCGEDALTGKNFGHRRVWLEERLRELASVFAVEVAAYALLPDEIRLVVGTNPEQARGWGEEEILRRWRRVFPGGGKQGEEESGGGEGKGKPGSETIALYRKRLSSLSWFMRCLKEPIARKANREDGCRGHFWESRFKCQRLADAGAVLTCMAFVDLSPILEGLAGDIGAWEFASIWERLRVAGAGGGSGVKEATPLRGASHSEAGGESQRKAETLPATDTTWLRPLAGRKSQAYPDLTLAEYGELLHWAVVDRQDTPAGQGREKTARRFRDLGIRSEAWANSVKNYPRLFARVCGCVESLLEWAVILGNGRIRGRWAAATLFCGVVSPRAA